MAENRRTKCVTFAYFKTCMSTPTANKRNTLLKLQHSFINKVYLQNETTYISLFAFDSLYSMPDMSSTYGASCRYLQWPGIYPPIGTFDAGTIGRRTSTFSHNRGPTEL